MSRLLLAIAVLLLLATVAAANATLTCTVESSYTVDTTDDISVSFDFTSIAPVFSGSGLVGYTTSYAYLYEAVGSAQWDKPLEFKVTLEHYAPNQRWRIDKYKCVYNNSGNVEVRYYGVVAQTPQRKTTTITFTVPPTAADYSGSTSVKVSQPFGNGYCSETPTVESWPNCPAFEAEPNKVSVEYPKSWQALQVNGRRPGDVVKAYGVNATIPDPWEYGLDPVNMVTLSFVRIDGSNVYEPKYARDVPVSSSVYFYAVGMPKHVGRGEGEGRTGAALRGEACGVAAAPYGVLQAACMRRAGVGKPYYVVQPESNRRPICIFGGRAERRHDVRRRLL
jgi:hypothetical protein